MDPEHRLAETSVELADTLVDDFDVIDFLQILAARCVELLSAGRSSPRRRSSEVSAQLMRCR